MTQQSRADDLARLARLDCCAVSDALDALGISGLAQGLSAFSTQEKVTGRVITVQLCEDDGRASKRHLGTSAVDAAGPDDVIVVAHGGRLDVAGWGGILALGAKRQGVRGVVIHGACRDIDEAREMGLPVYASGTTARTARGRVIEQDWNVQVTIADVTVSPADLVIADGSGVAFIPSGRVEEVLERAEMIVRKEQLMADAVRSGKPLVEVMGADYETMLKKG
ncbi:RraA family protein [Sphingobium sp. JS3065]|uniref:RraA family protein n=1 Tax=Sphingobium sp. JS3065 TaxID=2970925 RepID=UPI002264369C|nr:RraA family protein [Sphingobium sp. JS3065]UZW57540.1 RraA family protein [Sphingobium sp. JS3065]